jgi:hypothetical protein
MLGIPGPGAGLASAGFGVMLHLFITRLNQVDAVQQRGVNRMRRFVCKISEVVNATQPLTFLSQATAATAIAGRIKKSVLRTILDTYIFQYKQSRIR